MFRALCGNTSILSFAGRLTMKYRHCKPDEILSVDNVYVAKLKGDNRTVFLLIPDGSKFMLIEIDMLIFRMRFVARISGHHKAQATVRALNSIQCNVNAIAEYEDDNGNEALIKEIRDTVIINPLEGTLYN